MYKLYYWFGNSRHPTVWV